MGIRQSYNLWAAQYDTHKNRTRDLEGVSLREVLANKPFHRCLEIGCGTGKNTQYLLTKANQVTAVDFSEEMLNRAKQKITGKVKFEHADITQDWHFLKAKYDLITFSLVLEHIEDLEEVLRKAADAVSPGAFLYIGELHPFKQYVGTKAKFPTEKGDQEVPCFTHHLSDFTRAAQHNGFELKEVREYFDNEDRSSIPRILSLFFKKT